MIAVGFGIYRLSQDPDVRRMVSAASEGLSVYVEARNAPGADTMRELGCQDAMVIDTARLVELARTFESDGGTGFDEDPVSPMLLCQVGWRSELSCPEIVRAYVQAVPDAPDKVIVQISVVRITGDKPRCGGIYARDGTLLEPLEETDELRDLSPPSPEEVQ